MSDITEEEIATHYRVTPWILPHQRPLPKGPIRRMQYIPMRWDRSAYKLGCRSGGSLAMSWRFRTNFAAIRKG